MTTAPSYLVLKNNLLCFNSDLATIRCRVWLTLRNHQLIGKFLRDEGGSEIVEYAIVLAVFSILAIIAVQNFGNVAFNTEQTNANNYSKTGVNPL